MYLVEMYIIHYNNFLINAIIASWNQEFANKNRYFFKEIGHFCQLRGVLGPQMTPMWRVIIKCGVFGHNINYIYCDNYVINPIIASWNQEFTTINRYFYKKLDISAGLMAFWCPQMTPMWGIIIKCDGFGHNIHDML